MRYEKKLPSSNESERQEDSGGCRKSVTAVFKNRLDQDNRTGVGTAEQ